MKLSRLKTPTAVCTLLGVVVLGLTAAVVDQHIASSTKSAEIIRQRQMLTALTKEAVADKQVRNQYARLSRSIGRRYKEVTWGGQMPFMVNQLTGIVKARKINIETLRPDPITSSNSVSRMPLRITFKAGLGDVAHVIQDIQKSNPLLCIEQMDLRMSDNKTQLLQANMTVSSFAVTDAHAPEMAEIALSPTSTKTAGAGSKPAARASVSDAGKTGKSAQRLRGI